MKRTLKRESNLVAVTQHLVPTHLQAGRRALSCNLPPGVSSVHTCQDMSCETSASLQLLLSAVLTAPVCPNIRKPGIQTTFLRKTRIARRGPEIHRRILTLGRFRSIRDIRTCSLVGSLILFLQQQGNVVDCIINTHLANCLQCTTRKAGHASMLCLQAGMGLTWCKKTGWKGPRLCSKQELSLTWRNP